VGALGDCFSCKFGFGAKNLKKVLNAFFSYFGPQNEKKLPIFENNFV